MIAFGWCPLQRHDLSKHFTTKEPIIGVETETKKTDYKKYLNEILELEENTQLIKEICKESE